VSRVAYNEPFSRVGFRAVRKTDPFQAAHRGGLSGMGAMGDDSADLSAAGFSGAQISQILAAYADGALSAQGYATLVSGGIDPGGLTAFLQADPGSMMVAVTSGGAAGVPTGSTITYQGNLPGAFFSSADEIIAKVSAALPALGLTLVGYQKSQGLLNSPSTIVLTVRVSGPGFSYVTDAQAQIDHAIYSVTGQLPAGSSASVTAVPGGAGAGAAPQPQSITAWFEANAIWLALGLAAIFVLPSVVKEL